MARGILLVFTNPSAPEREAEFNSWYTDVHLPEFLRLSGVSAARRFELSSSQMRQPPGVPLDGRQYLAAYEVEAEDFGELCERINSTANQRTQSDVLERDPLPLSLLFEQIGETQNEPGD
jgi:hypothetical protein